MTKQYRQNGAIGAILDEYEKALHELEKVIVNLLPEDLIKIRDQKTEDPDCKSIQTILTHVVESGYNYCIEIRKSLGEKIDFLNPQLRNTAQEYKTELQKMFAYNEQLFLDYPNLKLEEYDAEKKILVRWGQRYDVEQLFEHAIVHILRHRRQIERFLL